MCSLSELIYDAWHTADDCVAVVYQILCGRECGNCRGGVVVAVRTEYMFV